MNNDLSINDLNLYLYTFLSYLLKIILLLILIIMPTKNQTFKTIPDLNTVQLVLDGKVQVEGRRTVITK